MAANSSAAASYTTSGDTIHLRLLKQKGVLLGVTQAIPRWQRHSYLGSYPDTARTPRSHPGAQLHTLSPDTP